MDYGILVSGKGSKEVAEWLRSKAAAVGEAYLKRMKSLGDGSAEDKTAAKLLVGIVKKAASRPRSVRLAIDGQFSVNVVSDALMDTFAKSKFMGFIRVPYWS